MVLSSYNSFISRILIDLLMFTFLTHYSGGSGANVRLHPLIFPNSYMNTGSKEEKTQQVLMNSETNTPEVAIQTVEGSETFAAILCISEIYI